jgi:PhnB protein
VVLHRVDGPGDGDLIAQLEAMGARFWVSNAGPERGRFSPDAIGGVTARMLLVIDDPEAVVAAAAVAGATVTSEVGHEHGWRLGRFTDPFGHEWEVGYPLGAWPPG